MSERPSPAPRPVPVGPMPQAFAVSVHPSIRNKPPAWREEYTRDWQGRSATAEELLALIGSGTAWIAAAMSCGSRSSSAFRHADLAVVDIDYGLDLDGFFSHPLARHALLYYTTASHRDQPGGHRFRVVFRLPERISDPDLYKAVVTQLIRALGGDSSCSDPCRIFYGYDRGDRAILGPDAALPVATIEQARQQLAADRQRRKTASEEADPIALAQAAWVLEHVLEPTADGERNQFVRITAAAASAGDALFSVWSDWASRGHHGQGKNRRQTSERFFRGFSGQSSLATLFYLAKEQDPDWRKRLPEELRSEYDNSGVPGVAGYSHSEFLGLHDIDPDEALPGASTPSLLSCVAATDPVPSSAPQPAEPPSYDDEGDIDEEPPAGFDAAEMADEVDPPDSPARKRGRPRKQPGGGDGQNEIEEIRDHLNALYPGLRLNVFTQQIEYSAGDGVKPLDDASLAYVPLNRRAGKSYAKTTVHDTILVVARHRSHNPVKGFLEDCATAEPVPYWDSIADELLGVPPEGDDNPRLPGGQLLGNAILQRFLVGAVARALDPGCSHPWMPILIGAQNKGKSFFFQYLTPPSRINDYPLFATVQQGIAYIKDRPHVLHAGWVVLLDECDRFFERRYVEELKNLVSVTVDRSAPKYQNERNFPRAFVLAGSTNSSTFMVDPTGNRRFMPLRILGKVPAPGGSRGLIIDLDRVKADRDAIWSAAYRAYMEGAGHDFSSEEIACLQDYNRGFEIDDPLMDVVTAVLRLHPSFYSRDGRAGYRMNDILKHMEVDPKDFSRMRIPVGDALQKMGLENRRERVAGVVTRYWVRPRAHDEEGGPTEGAIPEDW